METKTIAIGKFNLFDFPQSSEDKRNFEPTNTCRENETLLPPLSEKEQIQFLRNVLLSENVPRIILEQKRGTILTDYYVHEGFRYIQIIQKFLSGIIPIPTSFRNIKPFDKYNPPHLMQHKGQDVLGQCTLLPTDIQTELWDIEIKYDVFLRD